MEHNRKITYLMGFLFSIPTALTFYINSSFLSSVVDEKLVGVIYTLGSICSVLALLLATKIWRYIGGYKFLILTSLLAALSFGALTLTKNAWSTVIVFIIGFSLNTLIFFALDEFLKIFSKNSAIGRTRGIYLSLCHVAWIMIQLAFFIILGAFSFRTIYFIAFVVTLLFLVISFFNLKNIPNPKYDKINIFKYVGKFVKNKNLLRAYGISFLLQLFYVWMIIYTPIYLFIHLGFSWREIGIIFAIMLLPFTIIPARLGKYGDKFGERKMLMLGFAITSLSTLLLFFIGWPLVFIWALGLFMTRVGAASVEVMGDAYFFKHIKPENEEFIGVYRSASPLAYILGPLAASLVFAVAPSFNFIYVILGTLMLYGVYLSSTIDRNDI